MSGQCLLTEQQVHRTHTHTGHTHTGHTHTRHTHRPQKPAVHKWNVFVLTSNTQMFDCDPCSDSNVSFRHKNTENVSNSSKPNKPLTGFLWQTCRGRRARFKIVDQLSKTHTHTPDTAEVGSGHLTLRGLCSCTASSWGIRVFSVQAPWWPECVITALLIMWYPKPLLPEEIHSYTLLFHHCMCESTLFHSRKSHDFL